MLAINTMQARRTRAYNSTLYILTPSIEFSTNPMEGGGWYTFQAPLLNAQPRLAGTLSLRRSHTSLSGP